MAWTYIQISGALADPSGKVVAHGYSGLEECKNNPKYQCVKGKGPLPVGDYAIGVPYTSPHTGPFTIPLEPINGTDTCGRGDFKIHGDSISSPGTASHGCIIQQRPIRELVDASDDKVLKVISGMGETT